MEVVHCTRKTCVSVPFRLEPSRGTRCTQTISTFTARRAEGHRVIARCRNLHARELVPRRMVPL